MKLNSKLLLKVTAIVLIAVMLTSTLAAAVFAEERYVSASPERSLADAIGLLDGEKANVIIRFDSPSSLERDLAVNSAPALLYEQMLIAEQDAILNKLGLTPRYRYTSVLNGVALTATGAQIRELEGMPGVEGVYLSNTFTAFSQEDGTSLAALSEGAIDLSNLSESGYTGDGVLVAVIDSGINLEHEAFNNTKHVKNPKLTESSLAELGFDNAGYYNEKIPFYFDYLNNTSENYLPSDAHASHVAGIIGGYAENPDGTLVFSGVAPGAQICSMRILDENGAGNDDTLLAALEDAYRLNVDIINISFGAVSSFTYGSETSLPLNDIYDKLEEAGTMVICSLGNIGSMGYTTPNETLDDRYADYGTLSYPAIYPGNIGVGSAAGEKAIGTVINIGGRSYMYIDAHANDSLSFKQAFNGKDMEIVRVPSYGMQEAYSGIDVQGKIVAVERGGLSFTDKCRYATEAGAVGLIVINQPDSPMGNMTIENQTIPAIIVEFNVATVLSEQRYVIDLGTGIVDNPQAGYLSSFSSVGVTPDFQIGVDILGHGGSIISVDSSSNDGYVMYSGTSMASPYVAGSYAVLLEAFNSRNADGELSRREISDLIDDITQSSAEISTHLDGSYFSPRYQGAGVIDVLSSLEAEAYISNPIISLGYDKDARGRLSMDYELVNISENDKSYFPLISAITDSFVQTSQTDFKTSLSPLSIPRSAYAYRLLVNGVQVSLDDPITVPAGESIDLHIDIQISPDFIAYMLDIYPDGFYFDGFIEFYDIEDFSPAMHCSYVSYVGDWLAGQAIDPLTEVEIYEWLYSLGADPHQDFSMFLNYHPDANFSYTYISFDADGETYIGQNPIAPDVYIPSNPDRNAFSAPITNADSVSFDTVYVVPSLLRNCETLRYVLRDSETGEIYGEIILEDVKKDIPLQYFLTIPWGGVTFDATYMHTDELGQISERYIPSGTELTLSVYARLGHPDAEERLELEFAITVDYEAPEVRYSYDANTGLLTVSCSDSEYLAGITVHGIDKDLNLGDEIGRRIYAGDESGATYTEIFDLSNCGYDYIRLTVSDYASNKVIKDLSLKSGNISNMESDLNISTSGIDVSFEDEAYLYGEFEFSVAPCDGYCFTDEFAIILNGERLSPIGQADGAYIYRVSVESDELKIEALGVMAHDYAATVTVPATCLGDGELTYVCTNCSHAGRVEVIEHIGHTPGSAQTVVEPSCTKDGLATVSCTECGVILSTQVIERIGHTPGEPTVSKEATCTDAGLSLVKCNECGAILEVRIIPASGHDDTSGEQATAFAPAVCGICGESFGEPDSSGIATASLILSSVSIILIITSFALYVIRKRR